MTNKLLFLSIVLIVATSCQISPKPISYGSDGCHFCSMTIVDKQHAAQYVTQKGKAYSFDATECMMNQLKEVNKEEIVLFLVNDFSVPGELVDATEATYLISRNIPSPMGAYLSAFKNEDEAKMVLTESQGELLSWTELSNRFTKKQ